MNNKLLAASVIAATALASSIASAAIEEFQFNSADITATFSLDVIGGQSVSGGGELWSPYWTGPAAMTLVTLSTTDVHDLGAGSLSYRFGGGTDLIGDTAASIDDSGLVFTVNTNPNLDVGFNLWSNGNGSYTGFIAGNSPAAGQPIIYLGETGAVASRIDGCPGSLNLGDDAGRLRRSRLRCLQAFLDDQRVFPRIGASDPSHLAKPALGRPFFWPRWNGRAEAYNSIPFAAAPIKLMLALDGIALRSAARERRALGMAHPSCAASRLSSRKRRRETARQVHRSSVWTR